MHALMQLSTKVTNFSSAGWSCAETLEPTFRSCAVSTQRTKTAGGEAASPGQALALQRKGDILPANSHKGLGDVPKEDVSTELVMIDSWVLSRVSAV